MRDLKKSVKKSPALMDGEYNLVLYIIGASPNSTRALTNIKEICEKYLKGNYSLEVVDVYQQGDVVKREQIVALPVLVKKSPLPVRKLIGDLSDTKKVLKGLGIIELK